MAQAAEAASIQGKFPEMYEAIFKARSQFESEDPVSAEKRLTKIAGELGLNVLRFQADMHSQAAQQSVQQDSALARAVGVNETPTFFWFSPRGQSMKFVTPGGMTDYLKDPKHWK